MRVVYMGTPDFAVPPLRALVDAGFDVSAVITQPDKPRGRKQIITPTEVKSAALDLGLDVYQPDSLKTDEAFSLISSFSPDVIVVAAYGKILPKRILDLPKYGCVNIHASLLPKYRGAAPIQWAVINGEKETGISIMLMNEGLDTGDILLSRTVEITNEDTSLSMFEKLSELSAEIISDALSKLERGELTRTKQDDSLSSYSPMIDRSISKIDWSKSADSIHNLIRGLYDYPIAYTVFGGKKLKIYSSRVSAFSKPDAADGEVLSLSPLTIACGSGAVEIIELQLEGKKRMDSKSFLAGHSVSVGDVLG